MTQWAAATCERRPVSPAICYVYESHGVWHLHLPQRILLKLTASWLLVAVANNYDRVETSFWSIFPLQCYTILQRSVHYCYWQWRSHGGTGGTGRRAPTPPGPGHENHANPYFWGLDMGVYIDSWESRIVIYLLWFQFTNDTIQCNLCWKWLMLKLMNCDFSRPNCMRSTMLQDWLEALMLVSFEKDILLSLTNDLRKGCIIFNKLKTVCVLYNAFFPNIHKIIIARSGFPFQSVG